MKIESNYQTSFIFQLSKWRLVYDKKVWKRSTDNLDLHKLKNSYLWCNEASRQVCWKLKQTTLEQNNNNKGLTLCCGFCHSWIQLMHGIGNDQSLAAIVSFRQTDNIRQTAGWLAADLKIQKQTHVYGNWSYRYSTRSSTIKTNLPGEKTLKGRSVNIERKYEGGWLFVSWLMKETCQATHKMCNSSNKLNLHGPCSRTKWHHD